MQLDEGTLELLVTNFIMADSYRNENPEIDATNVFSISTLAYDPDAQVKWKFEKNKAPMNKDMFYGKAVHEFLQSRFQKMGYVSEMKLHYVIPFDWGIDKLQNIVLIGHVDLWHPFDGTLIEIKSSLWSDKITDYMVRQVGTYAGILKQMNKPVSQVFVLKINSKINIHLLTDEEISNSLTEIENRAISVANHLKTLIQLGQLEPISESEAVMKNLNRDTT